MSLTYSNLFLAANQGNEAYEKQHYEETDKLSWFHGMLLLRESPLTQSDHLLHNFSIAFLILQSQLPGSMLRSHVFDICPQVGHYK